MCLFYIKHWQLTSTPRHSSQIRDVEFTADRMLMRTDMAMASWRPNAAAATASAFQSRDAQALPGELGRQGSIARFDSASSEAFQQYSTVDPLTGLPPQPGAPMHAPALRRYDSSLEGAHCSWPHHFGSFDIGSAACAEAVHCVPNCCGPIAIALHAATLGAWLVDSSVSPYLGRQEPQVRCRACRLPAEA